MNWEKDGNKLVSQSKIHRAKIARDHQPGSPGYILDLQIGYNPRHDFKSSLEAEKWAEARMNEFKKDFILSLITKEGEDIYGFGGPLNINIIGGYDNLDAWTVYGTGFNKLFQGTLEECKNYIVECF